jgi:UrcA family protein
MNRSIAKHTSGLATALVTSVFFLGLMHSAGAQDAPATTSGAKSISLADLDLSTAAGAQRARERLERAVKTLCTQLRDDLDLSHRGTYLECVGKATATTNRHLDALLHRVGKVRTAANQ